MYSAAHYAKAQGKVMHMYAGNSFGQQVWRVSSDPKESLNRVNNTGSVMYSVTPDLTVSRHEVKRER